MRVGLAASTVLHSSVLVFMLVSFTGAKPFDTPPESMPVDIVSASEFTKMTKGEKSGKKDEAPKTVAEKVDAPSPVEDSKPKVSEKAPVDATTPPPAAAAPPPQPPQQQPTPPKAAEAPPTPPTADEALKNAAKPDPKPVQQASLAPVPLPPRKPAPPKDDPKPQDVTSQRDFNADEIKQLLDKRTPTRQAASASQVSTTASLGAPRGEQATLSQSEIDAFRARLQQCWITPGVPDDALFVLINVSFREDGSIVGQPEVLGGSPSAFWRPIADSAMRALLRCQPYTMLRKENYRQWKDMELRFTPKGA
jgi:colicin import membrane protein